MPCEKCGGNYDLKIIDLEIEVDSRIYVVEGIQNFICVDCKEMVNLKSTQKIIDRTIETFLNDGLYSRADEIRRKKKLTYADVGARLGVSKQRAAVLFNQHDLKLSRAFEIEKILETPLKEIFIKKTIYKKDGKYYLKGDSNG